MADTEPTEPTEPTDASDDAEAPDEAAPDEQKPDATTPGEPAAEGDEPGKAIETRRLDKRRLSVAAVLVAAVLAGGALGYFKYKGTADDLARMRQAEADRNTAAQLAKDYAQKSLTYSFENPDAFFRSVEDGVGPTLRDKFISATDFLKSLMLQAQVTSTGEVVATDPIRQPGDAYQVVVSAYQTTRNPRDPEPRISVMLLQVSVGKVGDTWQVSDIGPKAGSKPPDAEHPPPPEPGPRATVDAPGPGG
jgi:Mce-associated membrane protein